MKAIRFLITALLFAASGAKADDGDDAAVCELPSAESCTKRADDGTLILCVHHDKLSAKFKQRCNSQNMIYVTGACPRRGRLGACAQLGKVTNYYGDRRDTATLREACERARGVWCL